MPNVVVGVPIVELADVERIQGRDDVHIAIGIQAEGAERVIGDFIQRMAMRIGSLKLEASIEGVRCGQNQPVVVRVADVLCLRDHTKSRV